jgi:hypothetical protein
VSQRCNILEILPVISAADSLHRRKSAHLGRWKIVSCGLEAKGRAVNGALGKDFSTCV